MFFFQRCDNAVLILRHRHERRVAASRTSTILAKSASDRKPGETASAMFRHVARAEASGPDIIAQRWATLESTMNLGHPA